MKRKEHYDIKATLREMREEYRRGLEQIEDDTAAESSDYVVIRLGGERYGLPGSAAREVLRLPSLVRVPRVAAHFPGVINLRGRIVAVTDLRPLLGLPDGELRAGGRLVLAEAAGLLTALVAEEVEGIRSIAAIDIAPFPEGLADFPREAVAGQVDEPQGMLMLLDLERILSRPEFVLDQKGA